MTRNGEVGKKNVRLKRSNCVPVILNILDNRFLQRFRVTDSICDHVANLCQEVRAA